MRDETGVHAPPGHGIKDSEDEIAGAVVDRLNSLPAQQGGHSKAGQAWDSAAQEATAGSLRSAATDVESHTPNHARAKPLLGFAAT